MLVYAARIGTLLQYEFHSPCAVVELHCLIRKQSLWWGLQSKAEQKPAELHASWHA